MQELLFLKKYWVFFPIIFFSFFFLMLLMCTTSTGSSEGNVVSLTLKVPFEDGVDFSITSLFGERVDPIETDKIKFHTGIDLGASDGVNIVASLEGKVIEVGYSETGLGNYVYLEHNISGLKVYTIYGHMLDDSIVVKKGDFVETKQKIGVIGSTGKSTGTHLHFVICINKLSFDKEYLLDPINVIEGL